MNTERRIPVDPTQARVERWLDDSQAALPRPDPGRVLGPIMGQIAASPQAEGPDHGAWRVRMAAMTTVGVFVAVLAGGAFFGLRDQGPTVEPAVIGAPTAAATEEVATPLAAETEPVAESATTIRRDLLDGVSLETIEIEPGVHHVVSDGIRELSISGALDHRGRAIPEQVAGNDGSVWMARPEHMARLGSKPVVRWGTEGRLRPKQQVAVNADGVIYGTGDNSAIQRHDPRIPGDGWTTVGGGRFALDELVVWSVRPKGPKKCGGDKGDDSCLTFTRTNVGAAGGDTWPARAQAQVDASTSSRALGIWPDDSNGAWILDQHQSDDDRESSWTTELRHWTTEGVETTPVPGHTIVSADMAPGGNLWARPGAASEPWGGAASFSSELVRWDGSEWATFGPEDGVPGMGGLVGGERAFRADYSKLVADPRGGVWINPVQLGTVECRGVAYFDGESLDSFMEDRCIHDIDLAPDGDVWLQVQHEAIAEDSGPTLETYVIESDIAVRER